MDSLYLYIEINGIFVLLLSILLMNMGSSFSRSVDEKNFINAIVLNILVLIADTGTWILDGRVFLGTLWINKLVFCAYYVSTALFVFAWAIYTTHKLQVNWGFIRKYKILIAVPMIVIIVMSVASLWTGWLFEFDSHGTYERGSMFGTHTVILWLYLLLSLFSVVKILISDKREEMFRKCLAIMISVVLPVFGGILQTLFYGLNTAWTGSCVSFVLIFISVQNRQIAMDALTDVHNRGSFESNLREAVEKENPSKSLYLVMIDVNKFKQINDEYGHIMGDRALVELSKCLKNISATSKNDFIARYGGDEFAMICWRGEDSQVQELVETIRRKANNITKKNNLGFDMTVSVGWAKYDKNVHVTVEKFINAADEMMYENKRKS